MNIIDTMLLTDREDQVKSVLEDYSAKLVSLGSADAIALHLQGRQVKAFCREPQKCALAEDIGAYLTELDVPHSCVHVGGQFGVCLGGNNWVYVEPPTLAIEFIGNFDRGHYPELIHERDHKGHTIVKYRNEADHGRQVNYNGIG